MRGRIPLGFMGLLGGLGVAALLLSLVISRAPRPSPAVSQQLEHQMPIRLPEPEELGIVLPLEPTVPIPSPSPPTSSSESHAEVADSGPAAQTDSLHPSAEELKRMEQEGVVVY